MELKDDLKVVGTSGEAHGSLGINYYYVYAALSGLIGLLVISKWLQGKSKYVKNSFILNLIPGPPAIPFFATVELLWISKMDIFDKFNKWCETYREQGCFKLWLLNEPMIMIFSKENIRKIFGSPDHLAKPSAYGVVMKSTLGEGLATADVDSWKVHRKMLTPAVNGRILDDFLEILNEESELLCKVLRQNHPNLQPLTATQPVNSKNAKADIDMAYYFHHLFLDIITESVVGIRERGLEGKGTTPFSVENGERLKDMLLTRWINPFFRINLFWKLHPLCKVEANLTGRGKKWYEKCIAERRAQLDADENTAKRTNSNTRLRREAILDQLIKASKDPNSGITDEYIIYEMSTFIIAGHDTNTETLGMLAYMLTLHPKVQEKMYQEAVSIFGDDISRPVTFADVAKLVYTEQCIKEAQRLFPVIPMIMRETGCDVELQGGYSIPKGSTVCMWAPGLHRDPEVFPDPYSFNPEHFAAEVSEDIDQYAFCPYSAGLRNCLGKKLSMLQMKVVMARLLLNFRFYSGSPAELKDIRLIPQVIMSPSPRIKVCLQDRLLPTQ